MAKILKITNKEFNTNKVFEVETFLFSIGAHMNENLRSALVNNPFLVKMLHNQLLSMEAEIEGLEIDIKSISLDNIFSKTPSNEHEKYVLMVNRYSIFTSCIESYRKMLQKDIDDIVNPISEREDRIREIQAENKRLNLARERALFIKNNFGVDKIQKDIVANEIEIDKIKASLDYPTEEEVKFNVCSLATHYLNDTKKKFKDYLGYITSVMEEIS